MKLGDVADIVPGFAFSEIYQGRTNLPIPFIKVSDFARAQDSWVCSAANTVDETLLKTMRAKSYPPGTIIFPKVGGALLTNKRARIAVRASFDNNVMGLIPRDIDGDYLYWFMCQFDMTQLANTQALPSVRASDVAQINVPVPSKDDQRRIAARLKEQLAEAETARQAVQAQLRDADLLRQRLLQAAFAQLTCKPTTLGSVLNAIQPGRSFQTAEVPARPDELGVLKVSAVSWSRFQADQAKALKDEYIPDDNHRVKKNDLLISRANTRELVGAVVLVERDYPMRLLSDKTLRLIIDENRADKNYLLYALRTELAREHIELYATGTSDSMRNISQDVIASTPILLPPIYEQRRIAATLKQQLAEADALRSALERQLRDLEALPQRILATAFEN